MNKMNILFVGGDERQLYCAKKLFDDGFEISVFGFEKCESIPEIFMNFSNLKIAVILADAVVLPTPFSVGGNISMPFSDEKTAADKLLTYLDDEKTVFGGKFDKDFSEKLTSAGIKHFDFLQDEALNVLNADISAEGAVNMLMNETKSTLAGEKILVTGYGRIAKNLVKFLLPFRAEVTVAARKKSDLAWAKIYGCQSKALKHLNKLDKYDAIINTVPAQVLDSDAVLALKDTIFLDVAPYNDYRCRNYIKASGIPGKYAPETAGNYLAGFIKEAVWECKYE